MSQFVLEIKLGNAAMRSGQEVAAALRGTADRIEGGKNEGTIRDLNGNTVGRFSGAMTEEEE